MSGVDKVDDLRVDVCKGILTSFARIGADDGDFHDTLRRSGRDPTEYFRKLNAAVQDADTTRLFAQMMMNRPKVGPTKLEHDFEATEARGGVTPRFVKMMLAAEDARATAHDRHRNANMASNAHRSREQKGSTKKRRDKR